MATPIGHSRFGRTKGALGSTAGATLASGAHRMAVATDIAANITFIDGSRKTAGGTHRHDVPHRVGVTLSGSECLILLRDRSRLRGIWKICLIFHIIILILFIILKKQLTTTFRFSSIFLSPLQFPSVHPAGRYPTDTSQSTGNSPTMPDRSPATCRPIFCCPSPQGTPEGQQIVASKALLDIFVSYRNNADRLRETENSPGSTYPAPPDRLPPALVFFQPLD